MTAEHHRRRSIRLEGYDYSGTGAYYVTICTHGAKCLLGTVVAGEMLLSDLGEVVREEWLNTEKLRQEVTVDSFIVMPNHTHAILFIERGEDGGRQGSVGVRAAHTGGLQPASLGAIVGQFKSAAGRRGNALRGAPGAAFWQRNYYERVVRNEQELKAFREYIRENPVRWELRRRGLLPLPLP